MVTNDRVNGDEICDGESKAPFTMVKPRNRKKKNSQTLGINTRIKIKADCDTNSKGVATPSLIQSRGRVSQVEIVDGLERIILEMGISSSPTPSKLRLYLGTFRG